GGASDAAGCVVWSHEEVQLLEAVAFVRRMAPIATIDFCGTGTAALYWQKHGAPLFPYLVCSNSPAGDGVFSSGSPWKQRFLPHGPDDDDRRYSHRVGVRQPASADLLRCQERNGRDRALGSGAATETLNDEEHEGWLDPHDTQARRSDRPGLQSAASCGRESVSSKRAQDQWQGLAGGAGRWGAGRGER